VGEYDLAVDGAVVMTTEGRQPGSLYVKDGRVAAIGETRLKADIRLDATGLILMPGFVDTHVHLMERADPDREDWTHGTAAAAAAGVTTIVEHTHGDPVRTVDDFEAKVSWIGKRSSVDFALAAHAWPDLPDAVELLWRAGAAFFKVFTCATHDIPGFDSGELATLFERTAELGAPCLAHCEDDHLTQVAEQSLRQAKRSGGDVLGASEVGRIAASTGAAVAIAHVSHPSVAMTTLATSAGSVVLETCPQYLYLRADDAIKFGALRKFTPPTRTQTDADEQAMWALINDGTMHHLSSDHAPATVAQKLDVDFWDAPFGLPGIDTTSSLLIDAALNHQISMETLVAAYATNPAQFYGLTGKGGLRLGDDADFVLVDPDVRRVVTNDMIRSKAGWTPYDGKAVRGAVRSTYLRGRPIFADGSLAAPRGQFVRGAGFQQ
jgi:dihydroorotase (multifunctional complex type)